MNQLYTRGRELVSKPWKSLVHVCVWWPNLPFVCRL